MPENAIVTPLAAGADIVDAELIDDQPAGTTAVVVPADRDRQLSAETAAAIAAGVAASTRRAYAADRTAFTAWCTAESRTAVPASGETMAEWVRHLTVTPRPRTGRPAGPSTIERALAAVTTWHQEQGRPKPNMRGARAVLNAYKDHLAETKAAAAQPKQATAALPQQIRAMLTGVDRATLAGKRNAALVLAGFATAARVSELVALDLTAVTETEHGFDVTLYRKKVRKHTTNAVLYGTDPGTCPVRALRTYLTALEAAGRTEGPLFVRVDRWNRIAPPLTRAGRRIGDPAGRMTAEAVERLAVAAGLTGA